MKYLQITNDGVIDIRLVALMGGTTKSNDEFKIGQFGTGLKYTLAWLFRNNLHFRIFAGTEEVKVHLETEVIRDEIFEIICINGHRTSITTKMGEDWKPWMIIRELWCNALDEGGALKAITFAEDLTHTSATQTSFFIQVDKQIQDVLDNWSKYFIHGIEPMSKTNRYRIYPGGPSLRLYKNGVLIEEEEDCKSMFAYDILNAPLNELREYKGYKTNDISYALFGANEKVASYFLENITDEHYEGDHLSFDWYEKEWGPAWKNVLEGSKLIHPKALQGLKEAGAELNVGQFVMVPEKVFSSLTKQFERVSALTVSAKIGEFFSDPSPAAEKCLKKALVILEACGYPLHPEITFEFGIFADKRTLARVNRSTKKCYLSNTLIQQPLVTIVAALIEENEHLGTGFADTTRDFQQHFINLYTRELLARHAIEI